MTEVVIPEELYYTNTHEWIRIENDLGTIGITDYAQKELSDIVYIELPENGKTFNRGDVLGTLEAVKAVSDFYAPVSGVVIEVNDNLKTQPDLVNKMPYGDGWLVKIKLTKPDELSMLLKASQYKEIITRPGE
ncbi:MAG: glycine cleavage system protein GcvH [candidate division WOR-3 bacterium]|nr:glycine cleavage system protein GcvH [candidate division WOR-3 bacterium]